MIPLLVCSFLVFVFIFERAFFLRKGRVVPRPFVRRFLEQLKDGALSRKEALELCRANASPIAEVFEAGVIKWDRPSVEVEQAIIDAGERIAGSLRRHLRLFHGISTVSPLLGLLGTVFGMIESFRVIAQSDAMGRSELLAGGISEALISTATGLCVAIPAMLAYLFFSGRVDHFVGEIDRIGQDVVPSIASDGWKESPPVKSHRSSPKAA